MPANALRHPDEEENVLPVSPTAPSPQSLTDSATADTHQLEWRNVSDYVGHFDGAAPVVDRATVRRRSRRHKPFDWTSAIVIIPGTVILCELMLLVGLYTRDLKMLRQEDMLKKNIQETSLQIALDQNQLASYKSSPLLAQWAKQLGYRPIEAGDFDDVTSNAPVPAPRKKEKSQ